MSSFDMDRLMQQAAQMQEQVQRMQDEAAQETAQSSVGGGLVKVTANGGKPTLVWSLIGGALPTGIKLSAAGALAGSGAIRHRSDRNGSPSIRHTP